MLCDDTVSRAFDALRCVYRYSCGAATALCLCVIRLLFYFVLLAAIGLTVLVVVGCMLGELVTETSQGHFIARVGHKSVTAATIITMGCFMFVALPVLALFMLEAFIEDQHDFRGVFC